jgi:hypothetical protein
MRKFYVLITLTMLTIFTSAPLIQPSPSSTITQTVILPTHSGYINDYGYFYVVGEVQNIGDTPIENVNITATFYDSKGDFIALGNGSSTLEVILPGRKSPFEIILYSSLDSQKVYNYSLSTTFSQAKTKPLGLDITTNSSFTDANGFHITGEIKNIGSEFTSFVKVIATFYNASGYVIATKFSYSDPKNLSPNQTATFEILLNTSVFTKVNHYTLEAESWDYALVPEFNTTSFLIILILTSTTIYIRININKRKANIKTPHCSYSFVLLACRQSH